MKKIYFILLLFALHHPAQASSLNLSRLNSWRDYFICFTAITVFSLISYRFGYKCGCRYEKKYQRLFEDKISKLKNDNYILQRQINPENISFSKKEIENLCDTELVLLQNGTWGISICGGYKPLIDCLTFNPDKKTSTRF